MECFSCTCIIHTLITALMHWSILATKLAVVIHGNFSQYSCKCIQSSSWLENVAVPNKHPRTFQRYYTVFKSRLSAGQSSSFTCSGSSNLSCTWLSGKWHCPAASCDHLTHYPTPESNSTCTWQSSLQDTDVHVVLGTKAARNFPESIHPHPSHSYILTS